MEMILLKARLACLTRESRSEVIGGAEIIFAVVGGSGMGSESAGGGEGDLNETGRLGRASCPVRQNPKRLG